MSMNGSRAFRPFQAPQGVPIVGAPFTFRSWFPTALVTCGCAAKEPVLIVGTGIGTCPACGRGFAVGTVQHNAQSGQSQIGIAVVTQAAGQAATETKPS